MSLTPLEQQIMDLWDAGRGMKTIAVETGRSVDRVRQIVNRLNPSLAEQRWQADVRERTDRFAAALALSGGRFA